MSNPRIYGKAPYAIAVVHGGPGAAGEIAPVARVLAAAGRGVLEPLQTAATLDGQVDELHDLLTANAALPAVLVGWSWGAWLAWLAAARYPAVVRKLILVASGPFEERYAGAVRAARLRRLTAAERTELEAVEAALGAGPAAEDDRRLARLGELCGQADAYDPLPDYEEPLEVRWDIAAGVWPAAAEMRRRGALLELAPRIRCPVVALHGDADPHPYRGVRDPLKQALADFRFILLEKCGHTPWRERRARARFFEILERELTGAL